MIDVAIVGAGPVGLFTALLLGRSGQTVAVYERWPNFYPLPRACTLDHEIIRLLQDAGLADEFAPLLDPIIGPEKTYEFLDQRGEPLLKIDWNRPGASGWPQVSMFYQPDLERMLVRQLEALPNVEVRRGWMLTGLEQDGGHVALEFAGSSDEAVRTSEEARYVIGADGARSTVREQLGVAQTDLGFAYDWLVVDVVPHTERVWKPYVVQVCNPARPTTLVGSGPGRRRWEFMRLPHETIEALNTPETAWTLLAPWNVTPDNATLERHAVYTFRGAWAHQWKAGRVLLAGDAAHLMPPFLGQGLCSGLRDGMALSWRLAAILGGGALEALLESYGPERSEHVQEIIRQAVEVGRVICMTDPDEVALRDARIEGGAEGPGPGAEAAAGAALGDGGAYRSDDPNAGYLSVQGRVRRDGREGLFDDVVGPGWQLLMRSQGARPVLDPSVQDAMRALRGVVADFGPQGDTVDLDGAYAAWFDRLGVEAVLVRPDLYVFGTSRASEVGPLVASARRLLEPARQPALLAV